VSEKYVKNAAMRIAAKLNAIVVLMLFKNQPKQTTSVHGIKITVMIPGTS
jgi:hypothetical protein